MPLTTIYTSKENVTKIKNILPKIREIIADELSCKERIIKPQEISIKILVPLEHLSMKEIEIIINAHSYPDRIKKQDEICLRIKEFISLNIKNDSVFVWLQLGELGHSVHEL